MHRRFKVYSLSVYLSETDDSMGIVIGWDNDSHLTTKSNLSPALWILQTDLEVLLLLGDVIVYDVHCYLKLAVTWCKVQLPETEHEKLKKKQTSFISLSGFAFLGENRLVCETMWVPGYEIRLIGDRSEFIDSGAILLSRSQEGLVGVEGCDHEREEANGWRGPQDHGEQVDIRSPGVE